MLTTPVRMWEDLKNHLVAQDNFWQPAELFRRLHDAQQELVRDIIRERPDYFIATTTLDLVASQALYDMPKNGRHGSRWAWAEIQQGGEPLTYANPIDVRRRLLSGTFPSISTSQWDLSTQGGQIRVSPTPGATISNAIALYYCPTFGNMLQGQPSAVDATTLTFYTGDPDWSTNYGYVDDRDDYYNGMTIYIVSGTGIGQEREITDYDGGTRQATVSTWTTTPDTSSRFAVVCPIPEDFADVVTMKAALDASIKSTKRLRALRDAYDGIPGVKQGKYDKLMAWVSERQDFEPERVEPAFVFIDGGY